MSHTLPLHASVVVIGGGIMGCSTLYHLAKMGVSDAILIEQNQLTSGTTWHSAAQVRALRSSQNLTRMIQYSVDLYSQLESETGQSVGWIQKGSLSIATNPDRLQHIKRQEALAHAFGINAHSIDPSEAAERWPLMNADDVIGAVWSPEDGRVSPSDVCAALVKGAKKMGARFFEQTRVTGIRTENGQVKGVETTRGDISCDAIALCSGLWSREIGAMAGAEVPLLACEHFYLLTKPIKGINGNMPTLSDHDSHLYIRDDSGGLLVGCFEPRGKPIPPGVLGNDFAFGLLDEDWEHFEPMMENALHRLPCLANAEVKMLLNGPESFTPDGMFMLGETAETQGLFLGCGMNSVGMASGGGAGMNLAHYIVHGHPTYDLSEADAKRFAPVFNSLEHLMDRVPEILGTHYEITYPGVQRTTARALSTLPLNDEYRAKGAHFGEFYGWERPLYFDKKSEPVLTFGRPDWFHHVSEEVMAAHEGAAIFDASCFGKIEVTGPDAERFLEYTCASNMSKPPGSAVYTAILNERGTYQSDITAHRISDQHYRLFVGTTAIKRDFAWFSRHSAGFDVCLDNSSCDYGLLSLMGPNAAQILTRVGASALLDLGYFKVGFAHIEDCYICACRMSYVGEAGWEITMKWEDTAKIYHALTAHGAKPAGLYAQTSMRIEKGFAAMGHELDSGISPVECGLDRFTAKNKTFIGSQALDERRKTATRSLVTVLFHDQDAIPLGNEPIYHEQTIIGRTSSASFGYRINRPIALAHVSPPSDNPAENYLLDGLEVEVNIAGKGYPSTLQFAPAFDPSGSRMKTTK